MGRFGKELIGILGRKKIKLENSSEGIRISILEVGK